MITPRGASQRRLTEEKETNMSKRKKIALLVTSLALIATLPIGGTLAYFTDSDEATNVITPR